MPIYETFAFCNLHFHCSSLSFPVAGLSCAHLTMAAWLFSVATVDLLCLWCVDWLMFTTFDILSCASQVIMRRCCEYFCFLCWIYVIREATAPDMGNIRSFQFFTLISIPQVPVACERRFTFCMGTLLFTTRCVCRHVIQLTSVGALITLKLIDKTF